MPTPSSQSSPESSAEVGPEAIGASSRHRSRQSGRLRRDTTSDTRWVAGLNVGTITLVLGVGMLGMYKVDPILLYATRIAAVAVALGAVAAVVLLLQGVSSKSRRLNMLGFWIVLVGNILLVPAIGVATWRTIALAPPKPAPVEMPDFQPGP